MKEKAFNQKITFCWLIFMLMPLIQCSESMATLETPVITLIKPVTVEGITISVYPDQVIRTIPREIFGTNIEWFNNGNDFWQPQDQRISPRLSELLADQGVDLIRFPGGTLSDFYDWHDGIGPQSSRPVRPHHTDPGSSANTFGSPELLQLCRTTSSTPLITVNVGTGTPEMAAGWVAYMNNANNIQRQEDGQTLPLPVQYWEIGNELYLNGSDAEKSITIGPEEYAERYLKYASTMKAVDPAIKLIALGRASSYNIPFGPYENWNTTVLERAGKEIDVIALHNAYFPMLLDDDKNRTPEEVYTAMWSAPLAVDEDLNRLETLIQKYEEKKEINIAITEWGAFFSMSNPVFMDQVKTLGSAVYVARMMQVFLSHPKVMIANYFKFTDPTFMGWVNYAAEPKIPFYAFQMYAQHFGTQLIKSEIKSPLFSSTKIGLLNARTNIPELNVIAATNSSKTKLYINIVSCSWDKTQQISLDLHTFDAAEAAIKRSISGPSPLANNGPDLPSWWPVPYQEPADKQIPPVTIQTTPWNINEKLFIPPHSIITIELDKKI
ncbi:MAG: alpha-L-arabinofuranosidase C-terminal domain-containing protein [Desulfocapsaceae bacterium]|nr:alpha-L-arabinofuranosidase C-terminal domain-containing protein [Desulfocapsaceae bacterium]